MHTLFLNEHNRIVDALRPRVNSNRRIRHLPPYVKEDFIFEVCLKAITIFIQSVPSLLENWWLQSYSRSPTENIFQMFWAAKPMVIWATEIPHTIHMLTRQSSTSSPQLHSGESWKKVVQSSVHRFGHSTVAETFNGVFQWRLAEHFFEWVWYWILVICKIYFVSRNNGTSDFIGFVLGNHWQHEIVGASNQRAPASDLEVGNALRNDLFSNVDKDTEGNRIPGDLVARNIQRARDHGIPGSQWLISLKTQEKIDRV